ncbi:TIGR03862 family flavoprotein [Arenibacterium halophilum]|uniref:TIGR03862 family flavoprotein n=1 Tax=Arenibacterium halophilum TaxID=2583821 RepID=A0ABY2X4Y6_9RHOB|nr:TIGR03862 family flavoprotein [Arenibacterium halophilum]TMV10518.1 TIGR03862 family flavoprotein [Arenibacterium halophilum]
MQDDNSPIVVIGGGPAGLMAAEVIAAAGQPVLVAEAKPSLGRKLLMAGKSGLNLTKSESRDVFDAAYAEAAPWLSPMLDAFGPDQVQDWARGLGVDLFTGTSGRVFPMAMKASPLLRAWSARLGSAGVEFRTRWRWAGWDESGALTFDTAQGRETITPAATVLALGGASWARLGSDGAWAGLLAARGVPLAPFAPANAALAVDWSRFMGPVLGTPIKGVAFRSGAYTSRGEGVIAAKGLEGSGIYAVSRGVREGHMLSIDLMPDVPLPEIAARLARPRGKTSLSNHLRKVLSLSPAKAALLNEFARPLPNMPEVLAATIKGLTVHHAGLRPIDEAISTAGGVPQAALNDHLMLRALPGVFCAGEMLDWEAPTGGYLLTGCLATGQAAGRGVLRHLGI